MQMQQIILLILKIFYQVQNKDAMKYRDFFVLLTSNSINHQFTFTINNYGLITLNSPTKDVKKIVMQEVIKFMKDN